MGTCAACQGRPSSAVADAAGETDRVEATDEEIVGINVQDARKCAGGQSPALDELLPARREFGILLQRSEGAPLGLDLDIGDGRTAWVLAINLGIAATFNEGVPKESLLQVGDFIVEVNGVRNDSKAMLESLKADGDLALQVRRPQTFDVKLCKGKGKRPLGFDFTVEPHSRAILINRVSQGCLRDWNLENPRLKVKPNDRIFAVDGEVDSGPGLLEKIKAAGSDLELALVRPEEDAALEPGLLVQAKS